MLPLKRWDNHWSNAVSMKLVVVQDVRKAARLNHRFVRLSANLDASVRMDMCVNQMSPVALASYAKIAPRSKSPRLVERTKNSISVVLLVLQSVVTYDIHCRNHPNRVHGSVKWVVSARRASIVEKMVNVSNPKSAVVTMNVTKRVAQLAWKPVTRSRPSARSSVSSAASVPVRTTFERPTRLVAHVFLVTNARMIATTMSDLLLFWVTI